jgi:hypothetical protein
MSTTNPQGGTPDPVPSLAPIRPGSPAPDTHTTGLGVDPSAIARGHEEDTYERWSVFSVPLLVILFFAAAFTVVTIIFNLIAFPPPDPGAHPQAADLNKEPLNKRLDRIYRGSKDVNQPRLEDLKMREGNPRAITEPATPTGNSPWIHPEELRPSEKNTPAIFLAAWADPGKTAARIPIDDAMKLAADAKLKLLPTQAAQSGPIPSEHRPTASNAGRGFADSRAEPPRLPEAPEKKAPEQKKAPEENKKPPEEKKK